MAERSIEALSRGLGHDHIGHRAAALGQRVKDLLEPLEDVCRYRERRGDDTANFDVQPKADGALPFEIAIAPGGVNIISPVLAIKELPIQEGDLVVAIASAITKGHVRQVKRLSSGGKLLAVKSFVFSDDGAVVFKQRKQHGLAWLPGRTRLERLRHRGYRA